VFAVVVIVLLLMVLLAPSWVVLFLLNRLTFGQAVRAAWSVWAMQVIASIALIFLADRVGLLNPAGYSLGICALVGLTGAVFLRSQKSN
jgi:hypothetical protein